jgi:hypothetical protein
MNLSNRQISVSEFNRLSFSSVISLLFHLTLILLFQYLLHQHQQTLPAFSLPIQARLVLKPPATSQIQIHKKVLTTKSDSRFKIPEAPPPEPQPKIESDSSNQPTASGFAMPGAIPTPFSNIETRGSANFKKLLSGLAIRQKSSQQNDFLRREMEAEAKRNQLKALLYQIKLNQPEISGSCRINFLAAEPANKLECDNAELSSQIAPHQNHIEMLLFATQHTTQQTNGFTINPDNNMIILVYFNKSLE